MGLFSGGFCIQTTRERVKSLIQFYKYTCVYERIQQNIKVGTTKYTALLLFFCICTMVKAIRQKLRGVHLNRRRVAIRWKWDCARIDVRVTLGWQ